MFDFRDQTVVVTGGTRGIGRAISRRFLEAGATVVATYTANDAAKDEFQDSLGPAAKNLHLCKFDVAEYARVEAFYKDLDAQHKNFSVLVNNSGIRKDAVLAMMKPEDWQKVLDVNLTGVFHGCRAAAAHLIAQRAGKVINLASVLGVAGLAGYSAYSASKGGVIAFMKVIAREGARFGITANSIAPGPIETSAACACPGRHGRARVSR